MPDSHRFVLTGGPATGKTTLLNHLASLGYATVPEAARYVIEEQMALGSRVLPWMDKLAFQRRVLELQLRWEAEARSRIVFTDRGVHDGLAYLRLDGCPELPELRDIPGGRYSGVFLLSPLAGYETDSARLEDPETARRVHHLIEEVYGELGYRLIPIPPAPVDLRARRVLEHVGFVVAAAPVPPAAWTPGPSATTRIP